MSSLPFNKSHALLIGVSQYDNFDNLDTPIKDINAIANLLKEEIHNYEVSSLSNPTKSEVLNFLDRQIPNIKEDDRILIYFAGHGIAIDAQGKGASGYLLPKDADNLSFNKAIPMHSIRVFIDKLPCRHGLLILDCCFAGAFKWNLSTRKLDLMPKRIYQQRFDRFVKDKAWQVITSASYNQEALDYVGDIKIGKRSETDGIFGTSNSPFAAAFIKGLKGAADIIPSKPDGLITATELYLYLRETLEPASLKLGDNYRQTPRIFALPRHDKGEYIFLSKHPLNLPKRAIKNPYKGLAAFEESDSEIFYGRDKVIKQLIKHIQNASNGFTVLTGASGTGKSSLAKAGLLPHFRKNEYKIYPVIRPGRTPIKNLTQYLKVKGFDKDEKSIFNNLLSKKSVVVIDQFEELITQCESKEQRAEFIAILAKLINNNISNNLIIIITVRSDFEPQLSDNQLKEHWKKARFVVPPFSASALKAVILQPANQAVVEFESPELVDNIINEVIQAPGALPLLSFLLYELYETSGAAPDAPMKKEHYDELGGVVGALRTKADEVFNNSSTEEKATMKKIMIRMVAQDGGEIARRKVLRKELIYKTEAENKRVQSLINRLEKARLIVSSGEDNEQYIEPAHDALVRAWGSLWEWIKEFGEDTIIVKNILERDLKDYQEHGRKKKRLWNNNPRLDQLVEISQKEHHWLTKDEEEFINASQKLKRKKRDELIATISAIAIIILGLAIAATIFGVESKEQEEIARQELAAKEKLEIDELLRASEIFKRSNDYDLALEKYIFIDTHYLQKTYLLEYLKETEIIKKVKGSITSYTTALKNNSNSIQTTYKKLLQEADTLAQKGKYDEAIDKYTTAKTYYPPKTISINKKITETFTLVNNQRIKAIIAEKGMKSANIGLTNLLLKNADRFILNLEYDAALSNIKTVIELKALSGINVGKHLMEIVFWYNEIGKTTEATTLINTLIQLYPKKKRMLKHYQPLNKEKIRTLLKQLDPIAYQKYEERYYPKMITINRGYHKRYLPEEHLCEYEEELDNGYVSKDSIFIRSFQIAAAETTIWQFNLYKVALGKPLKENKKSHKGDWPCPNITFEEAIKYCNWLSQQKNITQAYNTSSNIWIDTLNCYRLPTASEWEFAALNGKSQENYNYSYINNMDLGNVGWYSGNSKGLMQKGKALPPNTLNLYDMNGNLREWCWHIPSLESPDHNKRICKGGSFGDTYDQCCIFKYTAKLPKIPYNDTGLRVVLSF